MRSQSSRAAKRQQKLTIVITVGSIDVN